MAACRPAAGHSVQLRNSHLSPAGAHGVSIIELGRSCRTRRRASLPAAGRYSPVDAASQELQEDLQTVMHLQRLAPELQLSIYPQHGAQYVRHRDAFPDDGSTADVRRVRLF